MSHKKPEADLRLQYPYVLEKAIVISLAIHLLMFLTLPAMKVEPYRRMKRQEIILVEDIPEIPQITRPPPPARPSIPIETESEDIPEHITIEDTELDMTEPPPPPPPKPGEIISEHYDMSPNPHYMPQPVYPENARNAGIEGDVILKILIDPEGNVIDAEVLTEPGNVGLGEAAIEAVLLWKFTPAYKEGEPVMVWIPQKIHFGLD